MSEALKRHFPDTIAAHRANRLFCIVGACALFVVSGSALSNQQCGPYACLVATKTTEGTHFTLRGNSSGRMWCFLRWGNHRIITELQGIKGPYLLREGYDPAGLLWRCDPATQCPRWMKERALCESDKTLPGAIE